MCCLLPLPADWLCIIVAQEDPGQDEENLQMERIPHHFTSPKEEQSQIRKWPEAAGNHPPHTNPSPITANAALQDPEATEAQHGLIVPSVKARVTKMTAALPASWNGMFDIFNVESSIQKYKLDTSTAHINKLLDTQTRPVSAQDSTNIVGSETPSVPTDCDDRILGLQEYISTLPTTPTLEDPNQRAQPMTLREIATTGWHGFKMMSTNMADVLEGTPFHLPFSIFNAFSGIVDTVIENKDTMANLLDSVGDRMCAVSKGLPHPPQDDAKQIFDRFSRTLKEAMRKLAEMRDSGSLMHILEADEYPRELKDIFTLVDEATKTFELELSLANIRRAQEIKGDTEILRLDKLRPSLEVTYAKVGRESCVEGTQKDTIARIMAWCQDASPDCPPIYWLGGRAGTGKSTIAYTICEQLYDGGKDAARRLGASFFCSRQIEAGRRQENIIPTIAHDLAHSFPPFGKALLTAKLDSQPPPSKDYIRSMLIAPWCTSAKSSSRIPPLVVVIDALDELERGDGSVFLKELIDQTARLEGDLQGLKFFITSREEPSIVHVSASIPPEAIYRLDKVEPNVREQDISLYLHTKLPTLDEANLSLLINQSDGLFIYAATIVRFVVPHGKKIDTRRLDTLLHRWPDRTQRDDNGLLLDHLYENILQEWTQSMSAVERKLAFSILETVVSTSEPVIISDIPYLLGDIDQTIQAPDTDEVEKYILSLHAVLYISDSDHCAYSFHKSFDDFLFDRTRLSDTRVAEWISPLPQRHLHLALSCFHLMDLLKFNICELPSSYLDDCDVPNLQDTVKANNSSVLRYACRHWAMHMSKTQFDDTIMSVFQNWLEERSLFWMEAMNLLQVMGECYPSLRTARKWFELSTELGTMTDLLAMENLATTFGGNEIAKSTPHLYISALAASSRNIPLMASWMNRLAGIPTISAHIVTAVSLLVLPHAGQVMSACFSPNGTRIVSGSNDNTVRIWDASTGEQKCVLAGHNGSVLSVCLSLDGSRIVSGSKDGTVRIWDMSTGEQRCVLDNTHAVLSVCLSSDGSRIVSGSEDRNVRIWDASSGEQLSVLEGHTGYAGSVCFSPDGAHIMSGSDDRMIHIWDARHGRQLYQLGGHTNHVRSVCFSPNGARIASGSDDLTVRIWDTTSRKQLFQLEGHLFYVSSVCFSPNGAQIISGSHDRTMRIWDATNGKQLHHLEGHSRDILSVGFSSDGARFLSGSADNTVRVWDTSTVQSSTSECQLRTRLVGHDNAVLSVCISSDGTRILSSSADKTLRIWDTSTGELVRQFNGHTREVYSTCFSPDGAHIVSGSVDETVRLWDTSTGEQLGVLGKHDNIVSFVCFSSDGSRILSGSLDKTLRIWDASTGELIHQLNGHDREVRSGCFSPDGTHIVSGSADKSVRIWDTSTGEQLGVLGQHDNVVSFVCFSSDGSRILSGSLDKTLRIWDLSTGELVRQLNGHNHTVYSGCFSPDGTHILSGSADKTLRIWDASTGDQLYLLEEHSGVVISVGFSSDGAHIVSGSTDSDVRVWDVPTSLRTKDSKHTFHNHDNNWKFYDSGSWRTDWCIRSDGWVTSSKGERYMWLNRDMRRYLQRPDHLVISSKGSVEVNFTTGYFGTEWMKCYTAVQ